MTDDNSGLAETLDAEYRAFVRSLHADTIAAVSYIDGWWNVRTRMHVIWGMNARADSDEVDRISGQWHEDIRPRLRLLINGHPDPKVRDAADYFETRLVGAMVLLHRKPTDPDIPDKGLFDPEKRNVDFFTIRLVDDGLIELRRAAYHAPFRVHRPEPEWNGIPVGNSEGLPEDILKLVEERGENWKG